MPTAFVCNCDEAAYRAIRQLRGMGYNVPEDISIVGYDNYLISEVSDPTITTINVDADYMADLAVMTLMDRMEEPDGKPRIITIEGDLVIKDSVKRNIVSFLLANITKRSTWRLLIFFYFAIDK
mgnify:CR=1 FL=1